MSAQENLDAAVDAVLDAIEQGNEEEVELDPLATILDRVRARGGELNLEELPPVVRMLLAGMLET